MAIGGVTVACFVNGVFPPGEVKIKEKHRRFIL
jgi:hypothetical protein